MSKVNNNITNQHQKKSNKSWEFWYKLGLESLGLIVAILLAFFTYNTLREIKKQTSSTVEATNIANKNMELAQRAYLITGQPIATTRETFRLLILGIYSVIVLMLSLLSIEQKMM